MAIAWAGEAALRDIKGPLSWSWRFNWMLLLIACAVVAVVVAVFIFLRRRKRCVPVVPPRPAHEIALEQLAQLKAKDLIRQGRVKEYYSEISDIIRRYLENRFVIKAPEMTTEEFLSFARDSGKLGGEHKSLLREFLSACDMVKFAKYAPTENEMEAIFGSAENFVQQTKEVVVSVPEK